MLLVFFRMARRYIISNREKQIFAKKEKFKVYIVEFFHLFNGKMKRVSWITTY